MGKLIYMHFLVCALGSNQEGEQLTLWAYACLPVPNLDETTPIGHQCPTSQS